MKFILTKKNKFKKSTFYVATRIDESWMGKNIAQMVFIVYRVVKNCNDSIWPIKLLKYILNLRQRAQFLPITTWNRQLS